MKLFVPAVLSVALTAAKPEADRVEYLPEMGTFDKYAMYSGYLDIPDSHKSLHYIFVESQRDPTTDPLIIWYNGGPGCSSMLGFAQEHGPYVVPDGEQLFVENEWSWNREANMLYIDQPAGVGYSYCSDTRECTFDDDSASKDNLQGVLRWFEKFPEFQANDLYLSGESYAGIYVPYLANNIDIHNTNNADDADVFKPNLKGYMVGNGVTNWNYDCTAAEIKMYYFHSMYGKALWEQLVSNDCEFRGLYALEEATAECRDLLKQVHTAMKGINNYNTDGVCYGPAPFPQLTSATHGLTEVNGEVKQYKKYYTAQDYTPWMIDLSDENGSIPPCIYGTPVADYFNRQDVREALHVPDYVQAWELCTGNIHYKRQRVGSQWVYEGLVDKYRILKFSGDTDGSVPTQGTVDWIATTGWEITETYRPFYLEDEVAGWVEGRGNFTLGVVHGAGHMAPQYKPPQTYHLIFNWINQTPI